MATPIRALGFDFEAKAGVSYEIRQIEAWAQDRNVILGQTIVGVGDVGGSYSFLNDGNPATIYSDTGEWFSVYIDTDAIDILHIDHYTINVEVDGNPEKWVLDLSDTTGQFGDWNGADSRQGESWVDSKSFDGPFFFDDPFVLIVDPGQIAGVAIAPGVVSRSAETIDPVHAVGAVVAPGTPHGDIGTTDPGHIVGVALAPGHHAASTQIIDPGHAIGIIAGIPWASIEPRVGAQLSVIYRCTLESAGNPTDAITIPIQSFQTRLQDTDPTWLQVVAPNIVGIQAEITKRIGGILRVYQGTRDQDGNETWGELSWCTIEQYQLQVGGSSSVGILGGHGSEETTAPKLWPLADVSYSENIGGVRHVRATPDRDLRPGDTVTWAGGAFVVGQVQHSIGQASSQMGVFEVGGNG